MTKLSTFVRTTGVRWLCPLLALVLLTVLWLAYMAAAGHPTSFVLAVLLLGGAGLAGTMVLVCRLTRLVGEAENTRRADEATHQSLREAQAQAQAAEKRLREAIDAMPSGFAIYDKKHTLVGCNRQASLVFHHLKGQSLVGQTHEGLLQKAQAQGRIPKAVGCESQWLATRQAQRGRVGSPVLMDTGDGRWMHHHETRTPSGDRVLLRLDVTELVEQCLALERANVQLAHLSTTDGLTGIANRRQFDQALLTEWQRSARRQQPLSLVMVDIDFFKRYNDLYGHQAGDECLRRVAQILASCVKRSGELVARYGGEEFALLLPGADEHEAALVAQRCNDEMEKAGIAHADSPVSAWLSLSIGVATSTAMSDLLPATLVGRADVALYRAKGGGRARVETVPADLALS